MSTASNKKLQKLINNTTNNYTAVIFLVTFLFLSFVIMYFSYSLSQGSADSARYLFSSVAQCQAAIIAIVITITLVAVQLSAQTYTPRAIDIFIDSKAFWSLLTVYAVSIIYDVSVLPLIPPTSSDHPVTDLINLFSIGQIQLSISLDGLILIGLILFILTFLALFLFIKDIAKQLKPDEIVEKIAKDIDINLLTTTIEDEKHEMYLLPLTEICRRSIELRDDSLALKVVSELELISKKVIDNRNFVGRDKPHESIEKIKKEKYFPEENHDKELDHQVVYHFVDIFSDLANSSLEKGSFTVFDSIMDSLGNIGVSVCKKESNEAISLLSILKEMDKIVQEKYSKKDSLSAIRNFTVVSVYSIEKDLWEVITYSLGVFNLYISDYQSKDLKHTDEDLIYGTDIGKLWRPLFIVNSIVEIAQSIVEKVPELEGSTEIKNFDESVDYVGIENALFYLKSMANISIRKNWRMITNNCVDGIMNISINLISKGGENLNHPINPTKLLGQYLEEIATSSTDSAVYYKTKQIVDFLEDNSKVLAMKKSKNVSYTVDSLMNIYQYVYENHCNPSPCDMILGIASSLGSIGKITMEEDIKFWTDDELRTIEKETHTNPQHLIPVTQKIINKIVEIGINSSTRDLKMGWESVVKSSVKYLLFLTTYYEKEGNNEVKAYLIQKIHHMRKSSSVKRTISRILEEIETSKSFGIRENYFENGSLKSSKIEMNDEDFKAFLNIKKLFYCP